MSEIDVILISSVRPEPTSGGQIILHRHLVDQPGINLQVFGEEPTRKTFQSLMRRMVGRLGQTRFRKFAEDIWVLWKGRWIDPELPQTIHDPANTVVMTVAHGDACQAALRFAKRHDLPLVTWFHDWWPDISRVHTTIRSLQRQQFSCLFRESSAALCVCEGMRSALGAHSKSLILFPIPASTTESLKSQKRNVGRPFKILYSGNLGDYGPMLGEALAASLGESDLLLQVRGPHPNWPERRRKRMKEKLRWLESAPRHELEAWLAAADAFLIPMVFDSSQRQRMETCFPSKLIEFAQFGKPLVIWGPEYCSAVRWARDGDKALCVTDPDPSVVVRALVALSRNPSEISRYTGQTRRASELEFNAKTIQKEFRNLLEVTLRRASLD